MTCLGCIPRTGQRRTGHTGTKTPCPDWQEPCEKQVRLDRTARFINGDFESHFHSRPNLRVYFCARLFLTRLKFTSSPAGCPGISRTAAGRASPLLIINHVTNNRHSLRQGFGHPPCRRYILYPRVSQQKPRVSPNRKILCCAYVPMLRSGAAAGQGRSQQQKRRYSSIS